MKCGPHNIPEVSVVMPVYNRESLVGASVASVLAQTCKNFELLVVDDGSTDGTAEVVRRFNDHRLRYIRIENSGRPAVPRNVGIRAARSPLIAFIDSDDLWLPGKLERQLKVLKSNASLGFCYSWASFFDGQTDLGLCGPKTSSVPDWIFEELLSHRCFIPTATMVMERELIERVGGFDESPSLCAVEDYDLWLRVARLASGRFLPEVLVRYRVHEMNISGDKAFMLKHQRQVLETNMERAGVEERIRNHARSRMSVEDFKTAMMNGAARRSALVHLEEAVRRDPGNRTARVLLGASPPGLYQAMMFFYRRRGALLVIRDALNRAASNFEKFSRRTP